MGTQITVIDKNLAAIQDVLTDAQDRIAAVLPGQIKVDRMIAVTMELISGDSNLAKCTPLSILKGVMEASQLGLLLNKNLGHGYLVPYKEEAQFQIGYRGFIDLLTREGTVASISACIVYAGEEFKIVGGTERKLLHVPNPAGGDLKDYIGAYAVVVYKDGSTDFEWMPKQDIEKIRAFSKASKSEFSPWNTWRESMVLKCPIRRICKRLKLSPEVIAATVRDEYRELGYDGEQRPAPKMPRRLSEASVTVEAEKPQEEGHRTSAQEPPKQIEPPKSPLTAKVMAVEVIKPEGKRPYAYVTVEGGMRFSTVKEDDFANLKAMIGKKIILEFETKEANGKIHYNITDWWQGVEK